MGGKRDAGGGTRFLSPNQSRAILTPLLVSALITAGPLGAQKVHVDVVPPPQNAWVDTAPSISSAGLLADAAMRDLLANGFPARLHYRLERWASGRWFDDLKAAFEWDV
ncbi:MAG: hypothetical protein ACJ79X_10160, partial [Gemmatimonadaceae bacterium]